MQFDLTTAIRKLANAARATSQGWMPVQEDVLEEIEDKLENGEYRCERDLLVEDIKTDATLFISALRQLGASHPSADSSITSDGFALYSAEGRRFSPSELLYTSSIDRLGSIVSQTRKLSARHSYSSITDYQAAQLEELMVSTMCSQALAFSMGINPNLAYTCAMLRQLGPSLAAWNYPDAFKKAFFTENGEDLDTRLAKLLGFSPQAMGKMMVREWNLADDVSEAISIETTRNHVGEDWNFSDDDQVSRQLGKICEIGEALGQIVHVQYHPNAKNDWDAVQRVFESQLGLAGIELVLEEARERLLRCAPYNVTLPLPPILETLKKNLANIEDQYKTLKRNTWLQFLPTEARIRIERFYQSKYSNSLVDGSFLSLLNEVLPYAGFARGCVYLPDPEESKLLPEFSFGAYSGPGPLPVPLGSSLARFDAAASAYTLKSLIDRNKRSPDGKEIVAIAAAAAQVDPVVVLYLETRDDFFETVGEDPVPVFRALMQFFSDCLDSVNKSGG